MKIALCNRRLKARVRLHTHPCPPSGAPVPPVALLLGMCLAALLALAACGAPRAETPAVPPVEAAFPRENIAQAHISYYTPGNPEGRYALTGGELASVLDALYAAAPLDGDGDAPPMDASAAALCLTLEADSARAECLVASAADRADIYISSGDERVILLVSAPGLRGALAAFEGAALVQYADVPDSEPPHIDPALRAALRPDAFTMPADAVNIAHMEYAPQEEPFYRVLSADEAGIAINEAQLLVVAACGSRPTGGFAIRIDKVEANEELARVLVTITAPSEGDWVSQAATSPVDSVVVDADAIPSDSPVAFFDQHGKLLYVQAW